MARKRNRRGEGSVYKRGRLWSIVWVEGGIKRYSHGYLDPDAAEQVRASIAANIQAGRPGMKEQPKGPSKTFGELVDDWLAKREQDDHRSVADDRRRWNRHLAPVLGHRTADSVSIGFLDDLVSDLRKPPAGTMYKGHPKKGISGATAQRVLHLLSAFYTWMIAHGHTATNPVRELPKKLDPKALKKRLASMHRPDKTPFLKTKQEVAKLFKALPEPVNVAYALSALAGLRPGEALALRWEDVDSRRPEDHRGAPGPPRPRGNPQERARTEAGHGAQPPRRAVGLAREEPSGALGGPAEALSRQEGPGARQVLELAHRQGRDGGGLRGDEHQADDLLPGRAPHLRFAVGARRLEHLSPPEDPLGHSSVVVTQRYAHLLDDLTATELARADVDLAA